MRMQIAVVCACVVAAAAADLPYVGKWKQNVAKSDFGQATVTYESLAGGEWRASGFGVTYKFKIDGAEYSDGMGGAVAWKAVDANTWQMVTKANGKVTSTDTLKLDSGGKILTDASRQMKPDGGSMDTSVSYERVSGGPGLAGKWKVQKMSGAPDIIEISASGAGAVTLKDTEMGMVCDAKLDGKDYPCTGPMMPQGFTIAMTNVPPRSLSIDVKKDGKPFFKGTYAVSVDGRSMVETGSPAASNEKFKIVFDRM